MSGMLRSRLLVVVLGLVLVAGGCTGPRVVEVPASAGSASLAVGETLRVDLGAVNQSIGDSWYLTGRPDPAVLVESGRDFDADCEEPGCGGRLTWSFNPTGPGTTVVVFQYCYRSGLDNCEPLPDRGPETPVSLTVTVR
jgi:predicted secreted protein